MPGQNIEIKAGVGAFSTAAKPTIIIGGNNSPLLDSGFARSSLPGGGLGPHTIPVEITYTNQANGQVERLHYDVKYIVGSSNTSIALPEMNVLYQGWDNKVQIAASGAGDDRVNASITGGTLTKQGGGSYIARVNNGVQEATITVVVDGKTMGSQTFRVRRIPDPVATVGGVMSNENMPAGQFKAQGGVGAFIKDFPLDLKYTVTSFTLTADDENGDVVEAPCQGNTWSPKALSVIRGLTGGRTVTIDNVRVLCPDGQNRKIPGLVYYIK
jgi:gliding motility-associated protein GldM